MPEQKITKNTRLSRIQKMGGQALKKKYGKEHFSKLGKLSAAKRWGNKKGKSVCQKKKT